MIERIPSFDRKYGNTLISNSRELQQKFRVSLKILWEPGSLVPLEYPTLATTITNATNTTIGTDYYWAAMHQHKWLFST